MTITAEQLTAIEERATKATSEPWHSHDIEDFTVCGPDHHAIAFCKGKTRPALENDANTEFVIASRTDVPALTAEIRRLDRAIAARHSLMRKPDCPCECVSCERTKEMK